MNRTRYIYILIFLAAASRLSAADNVYMGVEVAGGTAIGTGKAYWDWIDPEKKSQRLFIPNGGLSFLFLIDTQSPFQIEGGAGYNWNRTSVRSDGTEYIYEQSSLDFPLGIRMFLTEGREGIYLKGGTSLVYLLEDAQFSESGKDDSFFSSTKPGRTIHAGLQAALGYQIPDSRGFWQGELRYMTFYTSPEYERYGGADADIRFHRFQLALARFF